MADATPSPVPGHPAGPAVEFAEWLPALGGSRLLRVHGEASSNDAPTLVLTTSAGENRIAPRATSRFTRAHEWRASYLIAAELVTAGWSQTSLEWPGGVRLPLPDPPAEPRAEVIDPSVLSTLRARRFASTAPPTDPPASTADPAAAAAPTSSPTPVPTSSPAAEPTSSPPAVDLAASAPVTGAWTDPPDGFAGSVFEAEAVWTAKRAELERELSRAAEAIARARAGERAARDAVLAALAGVRADLRAARAARAADRSTIAALTAELEAERIAHAVTRRTAADLRTALVQARRHRTESESARSQLAGAQRDAALARGEAEGLRTALLAERTARANAEQALRETREEGSALMQRIAELNRLAEGDGEALARRAREHAESAAAASRRPEQETGELVANLAAAAATLRAARPPAASLDSVAGDSESAARSGIDATREERVAGAAPAEPVDSVADIGTPRKHRDSDAVDGTGDVSSGEPGYAAAEAVTPGVAPGDERAVSSGLSKPAEIDGSAVAEPKPLRRVLVALAQRDPTAAGEILAGLLPAQARLFDEPLAYDLTIDGVGTFAVTVQDGVAAVERVPKPRSRRRARFELRSDPLTLAEMLAGEERKIGRFSGRARVSRRRRKARVLAALPTATMSLADAVHAGARLEPAHVFAALPLAIDPAWTAGHAFTVAQRITDSEPRTWYLAVHDGAGLTVTELEQPVDATVTMSRAAFDRLLRDEPPAPGERPLVRGDRTAVALLKEWTDRARSAA